MQISVERSKVLIQGHPSSRFVLAALAAAYCAMPARAHIPHQSFIKNADPHQKTASGVVELQPRKCTPVYALYLIETQGEKYLLAVKFVPDVADWPSISPMEEMGGYNLYCFVGNDPISYIDPLGLWTITIGGSGNLQLIAFGCADAGYAIGYSKEKGFTHGPVGSISAGLGTPNGCHGGFFQWPNAKSVKDLHVWSIQSGAGVDLGLAVGADYIAGLDTSGIWGDFFTKPTYEGFQINLGVGFSPVVAEAHTLLGLSGVVEFGGKKQSGSADYYGENEKCRTK